MSEPGPCCGLLVHMQAIVIMLLLASTFGARASTQSSSEFGTLQPEQVVSHSRIAVAHDTKLWNGMREEGADAQNYSILSDGDNVTCIPVRQQLSLRFPLGPLQPTPSFKLKRRNTTSPHGGQRSHQTFKLEFGECLEGTIPVRRPRGELNSTEETRVRRRAQELERRRLPQAGAYNDSYHEHAYTVVDTKNTTTKTFKGGHVIFNLWSPFVESKYEFSLAQLWLISGSFSATNPNDLINSIEAGYQIFEGLYGDNLPRLFVFWTKDAYNITGCYNLESCAGFVQVSTKVLLGGSFANSSQLNSTQYEIEITILKDNSSGNWWLFLEDEPVGYWPAALYTGQLKDAAQSVEFGGEIIDDESQDGERHTRTEMGSGQFPSTSSNNYQFVAYQRNILYADANNQFHHAPILNGRAEAPFCYNSSIGNDPAFRSWGSYFFYGGNGLSNLCKRDPNLYNISTNA